MNIRYETLNDGRIAIKGMRTQRDEHEDQTSNLVQQITRTKDFSLRDIYEQELKKIQDQMAKLNAEINKMEAIDLSFDDAVGTVINFISNPRKIWNDGDMKHKKLVLTLVFAKPLKFFRKDGFGTASMTLPFTILGNSDMMKSGGWIIIFKLNY